MMIPELMIVGPGIQPCSIACAQRRVGVVGVVAHVADDRESRREHLDAVRRRLDRAQRRRFLHVGVVIDVVFRDRLVGEREMVVRVDEPGHHRHPRQVDHARARRNRDVGTDVANARAFDEDHLIGEDAAAFRIEQPAGANRRHLRRRLRGRLRRPRHAADQEDVASELALPGMIATESPASRIIGLQ